MFLKDLLSLVRPFWCPSWARLGPCSGHLGPSWGHLGPSWGHLGDILGVLAAILGQCWAILAPCWGFLGPSCRPRAKTLIFPRFSLGFHDFNGFGSFPFPVCACARAIFKASLMDFASFVRPSERMCARDFQGQFRGFC